MANKRKGLSKKVRFEVFKRDSFKCQYCGKTSPDVILEVDHIKPVKEGGNNDITNLITACGDCNSGKGANLLSDDSVIKKQRKQLEELNERREQLEMMMHWREGLKDIEEDQLNIVNEYLRENTGYGLNDYGKNNYKKLIKKHGIQIVLDSIDAAVSQYLKYDDEGEPTDSSSNKVFDMVPKICNCKKLETEKPYMKNLFYIRGILRNRFNYINEWKALNMLESAYLEGASIEGLKEIALTTNHWSAFEDAIHEFMQENAGV